MLLEIGDYRKRGNGKSLFNEDRVSVFQNRTSSRGWVEMRAAQDISVLNATELARLRINKMIGSWWLLREEESFFFVGVATGRLLMLIQAALIGLNGL